MSSTSSICAWPRTLDPEPWWREWAKAWARIGDVALLRGLLLRHGATGKLVRAYCKAKGWRWGGGGAPVEWFEAWERGLARDLNAALEARP